MLAGVGTGAACPAMRPRGRPTARVAMAMATAERRPGGMSGTGWGLEFDGVDCGTGRWDLRRGHRIVES
jgi:hypothetical protein